MAKYDFEGSVSTIDFDILIVLSYTQIGHISVESPVGGKCPWKYVQYGNNNIVDVNPRFLYSKHFL